MGFNSASGLDLPGETAGRFPPSRSWYDSRFGRRGWTEAVVLNLSIGQGETEQTLLRMVQYYSALATGRSPIVPHLRQSEVLSQRREEWSLDLPDARRAELVDAMVRVVNEPRGTAYWHRPRGWTMAGKTGTAQNPHGEPHSWFVGFAPVDDPRIVIAAIVENGHPDNQTSRAVPLTSQIVARHLANEEVPVERPRDLAPPDYPDTSAFGEVGQ